MATAPAFGTFDVNNIASVMAGMSQQSVPEVNSEPTVEPPLSLFKSIAVPMIGRSVPVIPLHPRTKIAFKTTWTELASTDPVWIDMWDMENPDYNGAACAFARLDGTWFLDADDPSIWKRIENETGKTIPVTFKVCSSGQKRHLYFHQTAASIALGNQGGKDADGKESWSARINNRYVVAANSIHPDTGEAYTVVDDSPIVEAPDWLVAWLKENAFNSKPDGARVNASPDGPPIPRGSHDNELFRIACMLRGAGMDREQILENLIQICEKRCVDHGADYIDMCEKKTDQAIKYPVTPAPSIPLLGGKTAQELQAAKDAEAKREEEQEKQTRQAIEDEQVRREHSESEVAQSEKTKLVDALTASRYDFAVPVAPRTWHYRGWIPLDVLALWLGARKAEKSLFALRKAMHDACGMDWMRHRNMLGPVRVLYFDAENDKSDVDERYREIVAEFSLTEQILIHKNLTLFIGKELKKAGVDIEVGNRKLYELMRACDPRVVYLDPWYQLQSIKAIDNEAQKKALEMFEEYFPNATIFLLHHTGRESQESLLKTNPAWLRIIGAERWSSKSAGGNVLTKKAELIICQERFVKLDAEGSETDSCIDFQVYSRSSEGSPLFSFKTVRGEKVNGAVVEYKFRREMTVELSSLAGKIARKLRGKGPWASRYEITKDVGDGGKQYKAIEELIVKGFIVEEGAEFYLSEAGYDDAVDLSAENVVAVKTAGKLLKELLYRKNRTPNAGVPRDLVKARAEQEDINWNSIRQAKGRLKVQEEDRDEGGCRVSYWFIRPESAGIALVA